MTLTRLCLIFVISSIVGSCAEYHPVGDYGGFPHGGYSDSRMNANTAVVSYAGGPLTGQGTADNYRLYRCAKVTLENGYDYFIVTSSSSSPVNMNVQTNVSYNQYVTDPPKLYTTFPRTETYHSYSVYGTATQNRQPCQGQGCTIGSQGSVAVIKMFKGVAPASVPNAYNAADIVAHYGPSTL